MKKLHELDLLCTSASEIIKGLQEFIEDNCPVEDKILKADNWQSWNAGEGTDQERQSICKDLTGYNFIPLEDTITIPKELWNDVIYKMETLHDVSETHMPNYYTSQFIAELNDLWKELEDLGLYGK